MTLLLLGLNNMNSDEFILGNGRIVDTVSPEELYLAKKANPNLKIWSECFIRMFINNKLQIDDFIRIYSDYIDGNTSEFKSLCIIPERLRKNRRLTIKYVEALMYVTFKRDIRHMSRR